MEKPCSLFSGPADNSRRVYSTTTSYSSLCEKPEKRIEANAKAMVVDHHRRSPANKNPLRFSFTLYTSQQETMPLLFYKLT